MSMHKIPLTPVEKEGLERHHLPVGTPSQLSDCFRLGVAWGLQQGLSDDAKFSVSYRNAPGKPGVLYAIYGSSSIHYAEELEKQIKELEALSVTKIRLDVVPGDGSGSEVYAKSVDEVVSKLSEMDAELEDWQLGIKRHPVMEARIAELEKLRAKGKVTLTKTPDGELVAVTRQDEEGRILSVIWERGPKRKASADFDLPAPNDNIEVSATPTARPPEEKREPYRCKLTECLGKATCGPCAVMFDGAVKELTPRPMETAPRDGTVIRLLVRFEDHPLIDDNSEPMWTIGGNTFDNTGQDADLWQFAGWDWTHDRFTEGTGKPVGWLPLA